MKNQAPADVNILNNWAKMCSVALSFAQQKKYVRCIVGPKQLSDKNGNKSELVNRSNLKAFRHELSYQIPHSNNNILTFKCSLINTWYIAMIRYH